MIQKEWVIDGQLFVVSFWHERDEDEQWTASINRQKKDFPHNHFWIGTCFAQSLLEATAKAKRRCENYAKSRKSGI